MLCFILYSEICTVKLIIINNNKPSKCLTQWKKGCLESMEWNVDWNSGMEQWNVNCTYWKFRFVIPRHVFSGQGWLGLDVDDIDKS